MTGFEKKSYLCALGFLLIMLAAHRSNGQSNLPPAFQAGQSMYIVAFHRYQYAYGVDPANTDPGQREFIDYNLDAEKKIRKRIEDWQYFKVAEKLSQADFVFLVSLEDSSMEGLAIPIEAYRQHFKERFDIDALREAALGRFLIGPLKLPTITRLADRLVKQFRERVSKPNQ
jgi:hypothetical protein